MTARFPAISGTRGKEVFEEDFPNVPPNISVYISLANKPIKNNIVKTRCKDVTN